MNNSLIITQTKLDMLQERVCRPTNYLATQVDSATPLWDGPFKMCQQIEADVFAVDSVVKEARKLKGKFNDNTTHLYQAVLCRVYIILYYLHNDDTLYKEIVFPRLRENMGLYNNKYLNSINEKIDKILEQEKLVKKIQEEKRKDVKPVFAYVAHKYEEKDYLRIEYNEEQLFRMMTDIIKQLVYIYSPTPDEIDVWFNAKKIVHTLRGLRRPELYVDAAVDALSRGQSAYGYDGSQIILICVYAMVRASKDNAYFDLFIKQMEDYASKEIRFDVIKKHIALVKKKLDAEPLPFEDYDYIGDQPKQTTYTSADLERYVSDYKVRLESLEKDKNEEIAKLRNEIEKKDKELEVEKARKIDEDEGNVSFEEINWHDKVRLDLLLRLMKKDGADLKKHGNKKKAADVMHSVTKLSLQTCKNYCSDPRLSITEHEDEILKLNSKLQALGMEIRL